MAVVHLRGVDFRHPTLNGEQLSCVTCCNSTSNKDILGNLHALDIDEIELQS